MLPVPAHTPIRSHPPCLAGEQQCCTLARACIVGLPFSVLSGHAVFKIRVVYFRYGDLGKEAASCLGVCLGNEELLSFKCTSPQLPKGLAVGSALTGKLALQASWDKLHLPARRSSVPPGALGISG